MHPCIFLSVLVSYHHTKQKQLVFGLKAGLRTGYPKIICTAAAALKMRIP